VKSDRQVWIVGDVEAGARAGDQRFHKGHCYVLDQIGNRDRVHKVALEALPTSFDPCQICAPAKRHSPTALRANETRIPVTGVQPGHEVELEDLDTGQVETLRVTVPGQPNEGAGRTISPDSPLGSKLIGLSENAGFEFRTPSGTIRRLRVVRFD
jgi:hypothetical protein